MESLMGYLAGNQTAAVGPTPTRRTSGTELDQWNQQLRASPVYQDFLRANNLVDRGQGVKLSRGQQGALEDRLREAGIQLPGGMHIDQGGNLNQKNRLARNTAIGAGIAAGGYFAAPYIGAALGGAGGAGGAGAAGAGAGGAAGAGTLASTAIAPTTASLAFGAPTAASAFAPGALGALGAGAGTLASTAIGPTAGTLGYGAPTAAGGVGTAGGGGGLTGALSKGVGAINKGGYWPDIVQGAIGGIGGMIAGRHATSAAQKRSPEEEAALAGAMGSAGQLGAQGQELIGTGLPYMQQAGKYYSTLLRGNQALQSQAIATPRAALTDLYRGAERDLSRSGVQGAARQVAQGELSRDRAGRIAGMITGVQPAAAGALADLGSTFLTHGQYGAGEAGRLYANLLGQGAENRYYARGEGERAAKPFGGLLFDAVSGALGKMGKKTPPTLPQTPLPSRAPWGSNYPVSGPPRL
jgi:hypothetical protein